MLRVNPDEDRKVPCGESVQLMNAVNQEEATLYCVDQEGHSGMHSWDGGIRWSNKD